jgi:hypothetical protein
LVFLGKRRGMDIKPKAPRRRCCECRRWFRPAPSASKTQKTCSKECRLARRAKQERARRGADLAHSRRLERERQRRHREVAQRRAGAPMSRAGLSAQASDAIEEIVAKLGQAERLSRDGLRRQLRRFALGEAAWAGGKTGT